MSQSQLKNDDCFNCGKKGHYVKQCKAQKKWSQKKKELEEKLGDEETTTVMEELVVFSIEDQPCISIMRQDSDWLVDSKATHHTTPKRDVVVIYYSGDFDVVKMENKNESEIAGIRDVHLEAERDWLLVLKNVRHVPNLLLNLLLATNLDDAGYNVNRGGGKLKLSRDSLVMA